MRAEERLLEAMNGIPGETVLRTARLLESGAERPRSRRRLWRTLLIAAVIMSLLGATAYAVAQFTMQGRTAAPGERFRYSFEDARAEWPSKYVFEFEGPTECPAVEFRPTWAPAEDYWGWLYPEDQDGWATLYEARELYNEEVGVYMPACVIDLCYAPQFVDGGALILMDFSPLEIVEEDWEGGVKAFKFAALSGHAIDREQTVFPTGNFVILFHPEQGWIIGVRGYDSMEHIEAIARSLEIRQLETTVRQSDFDGFRNVEFGDIYIG